MNAAKAKKSPAKVKGAVLIMILAVMTVMIILLAGSIAVVYSAHNRASVKYSESQGYYTARSVLDNFFSELSESTDQKDSTNASIGTYYQLDLKNNAVVSKPLCIGRSIELELYKPKVEVKDASGNYLDWFKEYCDTNKAGMSTQINGFEGTSVDYTTAADGHNTALYAKAEQYYVNLNTSALSSDSSTYGQFYNQYSTFTGSVASGMSADTIIYEIDSLDGFGAGTIDTDGDGNPDTSSQFGKLSDTGASKAWITVQVTERILAMGEGTTYADRFKSGKRSDDHIVAKVTAHVIYDGEEMTTTQIWVSSPPPIVDANTGLAALGGIDTTTSVSAIGDIASLATGYSELTNNSTYSGNIYFEGSFGTGSTTPSFTMTKDNSFFAGDNLVISTNVPDSSGLCDGALFYATRAYLRSSGSPFGSPGHQINLVTKQFESHSSTKEFYGNIYAERFDVNTDDFEVSTSGVRAAANTSGVAFSNPNKKINGNVYCNYLGIPSYSVYVDVGADTVTFKVNCDPQTGVPFPEADGRRIENMLASSSNKIVVYDGISLISGTKKVTINPAANMGGHNGNSIDIYENQHETYYVNVGGVSTPCDVFSDWHTTGINELGDKVHNFKTDSDRSFAAKGSGSALTASEYKVVIDWSNINTSMIEVKAGQIGQELKLDYYADAGSGDWVLDDRYQKNFTLPSGVKLLGSGENTFTLPTHRSIYNSYFYGSTVNGTVASDPSVPFYTFDNDTGMFTIDPDDTKFTTFLSEQSIDTEAILAGIDTEGPVDLAALPTFSNISTPVTVTSGGGDEVNGVTMPSWSRVISSSGYIPANGNDNSVYYIDARSGDLELQLGDGTTSNQTFTGTYVVYGDGHITLSIPGVIGGGPGQTVDLGSGGHAFIFMTEEIYSGKSSRDIVIGEPDARSSLGGDVTAAPNIDWYVASEVSTVKLHTGGSGVTTLCGYIVAPASKFDLDTNINGIQRNTYYFKEKIPSSSGNDKYTIFGSIFCSSYIGGQHAGVCYIPRDDSYVDDGSKPLLNKVGMYRSRS